MSHPIDKVAVIIGSQSLLAEALGISKGAVNQWKTNGRKIPAEHVLKIESLTNGKVSRHELRPDIYPLEPA